MSSKLFAITAVVLGLAALIVVIVLTPPSTVQAYPGAVGSGPLSVATTSAAVSVGGTSARVLATTTNTLGNGTSYTRVYASICNPSATVVYLNMNKDRPASAITGEAVAMIAAAAGYNACYEITDRNLYQSSVQASSTAGTVSIYVTDYVLQ